jgi:two-component sensor histidine kinase
MLEAEPRTLREAELEAENAHLRRLLDQAGQESERAFTRIAIADAQDAERQHLIVGELHHRAKNMLAMVQAIAVQTLRGASSLESARSTLVGRIAALRRVTDVLVQENRRGANLRTIVEDALASLAVGGPDSICTKGPDVSLQSRVAMAFAMILHELGTNAVKYGALSTEEGRVKVEWNVTGTSQATVVRLRWTEHGGPSVKPPITNGFGTRLLQGLARELQGTIDLNYDPAGVRCVVDAPLAHPTQAVSHTN